VEDHDPHEFIRRLLLHVLPKGFHRIRHYGVFANGDRAANIARARELLGAAPRVAEPEEEKPAAPDEPRILPCPCPRCGGRMIVIEVFARGREPRHRPTPAPAPIRIDTSWRTLGLRAAKPHVSDPSHPPATIPLASIRLIPAS
jgi:Putative transposase